MKSTPVRFSSTRMLRPSRPMIRPFMSSAESCTTDTVVSAAWPAASRCMQTDRMLRTRRSASRLVSSSIWRIRRAASWRASSSTSWSSSCLARAPTARRPARAHASAPATLVRRAPLGARSASSASRRASASSRSVTAVSAPSEPSVVAPRSGRRRVGDRVARRPDCVASGRRAVRAAVDACRDHECRRRSALRHR